MTKSYLQLVTRRNRRIQRHTVLKMLLLWRRYKRWRVWINDMSYLMAPKRLQQLLNVRVRVSVNTQAKITPRIGLLARIIRQKNINTPFGPSPHNYLPGIFFYLVISKVLQTYNTGLFRTASVNLLSNYSNTFHSTKTLNSRRRRRRHHVVCTIVHSLSVFWYEKYGLRQARIPLFGSTHLDVRFAKNC